MRQLILMLLLVGITLTGCAATPNNVFVKPGASAEEGKADEYACKQDAQQRVGAVVGGYAASRVTTNLDLYNSCMQARGWVLQDRGAIDREAAQKKEEFDKKQKELFDKNVPVLKQLGERSAAVCLKPEYAELFLKTTCDAQNITLEQLADNTKITPQQKPILSKFRAEVDATNMERIAIIRTSLLADDRQWADYLTNSVYLPPSPNLLNPRPSRRQINLVGLNHRRAVPMGIVRF